MIQKTDILVAGGGIAGLMAAMTFAHRGYDVICADPAPPITDQADAGSDLRSTAFLLPAVEMFDQIGLWSHLAPHAAELNTMRLCDAGGVENVIRETADFVPEEIGQPRFGYNLPNLALRREMAGFAQSADRLDLRFGTGVRNVLTRTSHALVTLTDGTQVEAELVIGADGRSSPVRESAGISVRTTRYGQKAIVFAVSHAQPHDGISTEIHRTGGPFTLVPLPDAPTGTHRSAIVWMETGPKASALMELDEAAFTAAATERSCHVLGPLTLESPRRIWPIISQEAQALTARRIALIAEAAHVMPPIGAQGLNTSFADIAALRDASTRHGLGTPEMLADYASARSRDISLRERGVEWLNRAAMTDVQALRDLRRRGLAAISGLAPIRQTAMRTGMGLSRPGQ
ncbi:FAD-dependent monooxygenase [Pontivivens insulae]|uniref:2-octaprenylphenol hydroxylase n=1 Tax=Pontivivens insulae TaxID=1639689 RepID=A0A2R8AA08_9RHOB|nr:FAD-dependent monooxygenase [Pontivivens insulae]RED12829.1 2-octaprenyl-6-methoxyphenol hydroxylase [Pontivivens insulae]SPF28920.1 2-octaprenylphenol hydroxylase [Pontivivens insulae]